jgi:hypothetical protein
MINLQGHDHACEKAYQRHDAHCPSADVRQLLDDGRYLVAPKDQQESPPKKDG